MTPSTILKRIKDEKVITIDFRFTDLLGQWHHMTYHHTAVNEALLNNGIMFDGSSISGWRMINNSDMVMKPDLATATLDPFSVHKTLIITCDIADPATGQSYERDPRSIAKKAEAYLTASTIADTAYFGPEPEFFIFDDVRFHVGMNEAYYHIDALDAPHNSGKIYEAGNLGYRPGVKGGYFPVQPVDHLNDLRTEMLETLEAMGLKPEKHHHEVASSQHELGFECNTLTATADAIQIYKYVIRNVAYSYGKAATFMPKPVAGDNGSGMHVHQSLWKQGDTLFAGDGYAGLSETALYYIGGIIKHGRALNAFTNPSTNSYKRLVPGYEAPVILAYAAKNRSVAIRIPHTASAKARRMEARFPDPLANPYLSFAAMLLAGLDGIKNKIHPGQAAEENLYETASALPTLAGSLQEALEALTHDRAFLTQTGVFTDDILDAYITLKRPEVEVVRLAPHPLEFKQYFAL